METTFAQLSPYINGLLVIILFWREYTSGNNKINKEVVDNYKTLVEQKNEQIAKESGDLAETKKALRTSQQECITKVSTLEGAAKEKDETIKRQQATIENRNPELVGILTRVADFMEKLTERMDKNESILNDQTQMLKTGQTRNEYIDKATEDEKGKTLRKD